MILIIDYGAGNTASVANALNEVGLKYHIAKNIDEVEEFEKIILPGVGQAEYAMQQLLKRGFVDLIKSTNKKLLGICLGMQLLVSKSEEGDTKCLSILPNTSIKFKNRNYKIPHMGWNKVYGFNDSALFKNIKGGSYFYFAHSYFIENGKYTIANSDHGLEFTSVLSKENYYGVQFHPEKSGVNGLQLLKNFGDL